MSTPRVSSREEDGSVCFCILNLLYADSCAVLILTFVLFLYCCRSCTAVVLVLLFLYCCSCTVVLVLVPGLTWGDRRAGRRPQSARNSSREAVRILRDRTFRDRRVRHSTRLIRLRQTDSDPADCTITICPAIVPPSFAVGASARARGRDQKKGEAHRRRPRHRGISSSSSWK